MRRDPILIAEVAVMIVLAALLVTVAVSGHRQEGRPLHNAYWPFSVEMQVKDC